VVFSGGVGEYVYGKEPNSFGDLGAPLGRALQRHIGGDALAWPLAPARECIRATVMGAAQHTVQVSGNTLYRSNDALLPRKNLQVLRPDVDLSHDIDANGIAQSIKSHFQAFDLTEGKSEIALVFRWSGPPSAVRIAAFCRGLMQGLKGTLTSGLPIYLVFDRDLAGLVGIILKNDFELKNDVLAIDGITLHDFDFIDLGKALEPSGTVPVTIKSLVFHL
jgi:ethanolamine utilization protein EutA